MSIGFSICPIRVACIEENTARNENWTFFFFFLSDRESQSGSLCGFPITHLSHYDLGHLSSRYIGGCWPADPEQVAGGKNGCGILHTA